MNRRKTDRRFESVGICRMEEEACIVMVISPSASVSACASPLDERFHEGGNRGTDDLLADSSFAVSGTRSGIMARWRQAVEAAMTDEEIGSLTVLARSRTEPASRGERAQVRLAYRGNPSFVAGGERPGVL